MPDRHTLPRPDILIFDVDGTLIDVSNSYRATVPAAIGRYLALLGLTPPPLTGEIYDQFKLMGGFNDDWDLTAGCLAALLAPLPSAASLNNGRQADQAALLAEVQAAATPLAGLTPQLPDWATFVPAVRAAGGGLAGVRQVVGLHNSQLIWRTGHILTTDLVQRLFSELYLGGELFTESYGIPPRFHDGAGAIETEQLLISTATLETLGRGMRLGLATGRNNQELRYPLARWGLGRFFTVKATMTDAHAARTAGGPSLLKPHPFLLERAADAIDPTRRLVAAYIGDMPDDIVAARRADGERRWLAIGIAHTEARAEHQRALGADLVFRHPDELAEQWPEQPRRRGDSHDLCLNRRHCGPARPGRI